MAAAGIFQLGTSESIAAPVTGLDICYMNATDLASSIRRKDLSSVEVMTAFLDRIDQVNPKVNAIVSLVDRDTALGMAMQADADLRDRAATVLREALGRLSVLDRATAPGPQETKQSRPPGTARPKAG
jgi:hypothetical protein